LKHRGLSQFHPSSTANIAALAVNCLDLPESRIVDAADPDCPTDGEIAEHVARAMNHDWQIIRLSEEHSTGPVGETLDTPNSDRPRHVGGSCRRLSADHYICACSPDARRGGTRRNGGP
jgi:hypothetical protein